MNTSAVILIAAAALVILNAVSFSLMAYDKSCAKKGKWRVPEKTLFIAAACFGGLGGVLGMTVCRHKTQHWYFRLFFPIFLAVSVSLAVRALYELIEYSTCVFSVDGADDFVGSQGDPFDTQTDMLGAFIGALAAVFIFLKFRWRTNLNSCDETGC